MHSIRRSLLWGLAATACLAVASAFRSSATAARSLAVVTVAYVLVGLRLFVGQGPAQAKALHPREELTARERDDLYESPAARPTVSPRWRMVPST